MSLPRSITEKLLRAKHHRWALRELYVSYFKTNGDDIRVDNTGHALAVIAPPIPWEIPHIVGDFAQNLRSSLDYLAHELCIRSNHQPTKDTAFPVCYTPKCFADKRAVAALEGIDSAMVAEIEAVQPYISGQPDLSDIWILHDLCNMNKHRRIPLAVLQLNTLPKGQAIPAEMDMNGELVASIAFSEGALKKREVLLFTKQMIWYFEHVLLARFDKFF